MFVIVTVQVCGAGGNGGYIGQYFAILVICCKMYEGMRYVTESGSSVHRFQKIGERGNGDLIKLIVCGWWETANYKVVVVVTDY